MESKELYNLLDKLGLIIIEYLSYEYFEKKCKTLVDTIELVEDIRNNNSEENIKNLLLCIFYKGGK